MAVTVKLPTILRKHAGNEAKVSAEGSTLVEVLKDLESRYPGITKNVIADDGGLHRFINVYLNDEDVRYLGSLETPVSDGDTGSTRPAVAGGSAPRRRPALPDRARCSDLRSRFRAVRRVRGSRAHVALTR